jgi:membrane-associated protein
LFIAGFLASSAGGEKLPGGLPAVAGVAFAAAVIGDQVGYLFGKKVGPSLFDRPSSRFFRPSNVAKAQAFFDKHGSKTIVLARFVPIVRTFAPIVAGVGNMKYRTFVTYNVLGGALWGIGLTTLGYFLGEIEFIEKNLEVAILIIVAISVLPVAWELFKHRREAAKVADDIGEDIEDMVEERFDRG